MKYNPILPGGLLLASALLGGCVMADYSPPRVEHEKVVVVDEDRGGPPPWVPAHGYQHKVHYRYYYDREVYYNIDRGEYIWLEGGRWNSARRLPDHLSRGLGECVTVDLEGDRPQAYHESIRRHYPTHMNHDQRDNRDNDHRDNRDNGHRDNRDNDHRDNHDNDHRDNHDNNDRGKTQSDNHDRGRDQGKDQSNNHDWGKDQGRDQANNHDQGKDHNDKRGHDNNKPDERNRPDTRNADHQVDRGREQADSHDQKTRKDLPSGSRKQVVGNVKTNGQATDAKDHDQDKGDPKKDKDKVVTGQIQNQ